MSPSVNGVHDTFAPARRLLGFFEGRRDSVPHDRGARDNAARGHTAVDTPPKRILERGTLMPRLARSGLALDPRAISRDDADLLRPARATAGRGDRLRHVAPPQSALLRGLPRLLDERGEVALRRRLEDFEDHDVLVAEHDELCTRFEPEAFADLFGDDDLALGGQGGRGGCAHSGWVR